MDRNLGAMQIVVVVMVALRKESVDRNKQIIDLKAIDKRSLSARRAWIEIIFVFIVLQKINSRSPQGERG